MKILRLENKVAIVTGGASGIGREIAIKFSEEGAKVVIADLREEPLAEEKPTLEVIKENGGEAIFVNTDVSSEEDVDKMFINTIEEFGDVDILVNNAGIYSSRKLHELDKEGWEKTMQVNLTGVFNCSKKVIDYFMNEEKSGKIINISSIAGLVGYAESPAYCASKGAVTNLTRELALDYAPHRINVNAICPGVIKTSMTEEFREDPERKSFLEENTPYPRLGTPEDIANAALFLASSESDFVNGENLVVDGGWMVK